MAWNKKEIELADGTVVQAQVPVIVSASRATDIPAFYGEWLLHRLQEGYVKWKNPFNNKFLYISLEQARVMVFWTKDPAPFLSSLSRVEQWIPNYYFQFTLNEYEAEGLEPSLPGVEKRLDTFRDLSERIGKEKVIWRFDPLILTDKIGVDELLRKVERIGYALKDHTCKLVFSFADIGSYRKVGINLRKGGVEYREFDERTMREFAAGLQQLNKEWGLELSTCAEQMNLQDYGITPNKCVDDVLMGHLFSQDDVLMDFLKGVRKDPGQRAMCGCVFSKDIGAYNTCPHFCLYCYANASKEQVMKNRQHFILFPSGESITGN